MDPLGCTFRGVERYLSLGEVADRIGVTLNTAKSYLRKDLLPAPDAMTGRVRGWIPDTIDAWNQARPGSGRRSHTPPHDGQEQE